jgi:hypothetical protein
LKKIQEIEQAASRRTGNHGYRYGNAPVTLWFKKQFAPEKMLMGID